MDSAPVPVVSGPEGAGLAATSLLCRNASGESARLGDRSLDASICGLISQQMHH